MARILIVDGDYSTARAFTHPLRTTGHAPLPAPTGRPALLAARAHPDVILLNLGLPDISEDEVPQRLKREPETARIPVVVVSGDPDAADRVPRDRATGAVTILHKPAGGAELCTVVDLVLEDRRWEVVEEATRRVLATHPDVEILMLSMSEDEDAVFEAVKNGARGYVLKTAGPVELFDALRGILRGEVPLGEAASSRTRRHAAKGSAE
jgi:DNA-binding response OmpR family regulator